MVLAPMVNGGWVFTLFCAYGHLKIIFYIEDLISVGFYI